MCEVDLKYKSRFDRHIKTARHLALAGVHVGGGVGDNVGLETPNSPDNQQDHVARDFIMTSHYAYPGPTHICAHA